MVCDLDFIVLSRNILRSVNDNDIPIAKPAISLLLRIAQPGFCTIPFTITFAGQTNVDRYTGNIAIPKIVIPGSCPIPFTITFAGQTNVVRYTGNIAIPKICPIPFATTFAGQTNVDRYII